MALSMFRITLTVISWAIFILFCSFPQT